MVLRTLEMQGFKSFPDKTELKFGKGITAVVGPNGSGKSNISDAVRWVLGEQRTKSLRGSKMEDVIFGGTSARRPLGYAQVTLTLDNADRTIKDKGDIISVSRRYYRSGESEYKIDGEVVRRKDIRELFMDTGLATGGYSIVGQGKIDSIISQKNEDRREIFEEAAGISKFRSKRTDAMRKLEQAEENLVRLLDILGELEGRVEPLRIQSEKAQKFLEYAGEKKELEVGIWMHRINKFTQDLKDQQAKIESTKLSHSQAEHELEAIVSEIESIMAKTSEIAVEIDDIRRKTSSHEEEALKHDAQIKVLEANIEHNNETIERIRRDIDNSNNESNAIDDMIKAKEKLIADVQVLIDEKKKELELNAKEIEKVESANLESSQQSFKLSSEISAITLKLSDSKVKSSQALSSIDEIKSRRQVVSQMIDDVEKSAVEIRHRKDESEKNLAFLDERINEYSNTLSGCQIKLKNRGEKAAAFKNELDAMNVEFSSMSARVRMLRDLEKNMEGYSGAVKLVMKQAAAGALSGILGPVSQLINVENEYAVAVETALGAAMQNIITNSDADAKRAIMFLKNNKGGRATFLPVSAIKGRTLTESGLDDCFGYIDVASNLVNCDSKYRQIVDNLLGKTVVCEDMDSAIGMAKRYSYRFRIVTLDGQLINAGGSMTGGSQIGKAGMLSRGVEIEKTQEKVKRIQEEIERKTAEFKVANEEYARAKADFDGAQADLINAKEEKIRAQGEDNLIGEQLASAEKSLAQLKDEAKNSQARIDLFTAADEKAKKEIEEYTAQIKVREDELSRLSGDSEELKKKRERFSQLASEINLQIIAASKDSESAKQQIEELLLRKDSQSDRVKEIENEISSINERNEEIKHTIDEVRRQADEFRQLANQSQQKIEQLIENRNELESRNTKLRLEERNRTADREKLSTELGRLEERCDSMTKEYEDIINKLYDEYQLTRADAMQVGKQIDDVPAATRRLNELKSKIRSLGSVNVSAIEEYKEVSERYVFLKNQVDDVEKSKKELTKIIDDLTRSMSDKFRVQFDRINTQFKTCFAEFFNGGHGELLLEDPSNVLESPIEIKIQPPGKSVQNINLFSGGEKSLAAMALLFAILKVTPSPFCIYDEVEAALDDVNVDRFAKYMRKMTDKTQFISITHRRGTMEEADVLYGVTMQEKGVSKLLEMQTTELANQLGIE